jgi:hypothetical protein
MKILLTVLLAMCLTYCDYDPITKTTSCRTYCY